MGILASPVDMALLVPMQAEDMDWLDPVVRRTRSPSLFAGVRALQRVEDLVGRPIRSLVDVPARFRDATNVGSRTLGAVVLATALERAGLRWHVEDPGASEPLPVWRGRIERLARLQPAVVGINTTYVLDVGFAGVLCALVRQHLPRAKLVLGGYLYSTDTRGFLALDADVLCIGEGERRIVDITRRLLSKEPLDDIPGLYARGPDGRLRSTGRAEPLPLDEQPLPDWSLASRMSPPLPDDAELSYHVETQRGCVFKCSYCTFRTVSAPMERSIDGAVTAILDAARRGRGRVWIVDPTLTFPRERCKTIFEGVVARGGSPIPLQIYARVTDLDDEVCALMARAGVRDVFIGQESGDQRILERMRKGTHIDDVRPAMEAMARHGLCARYSFIFGFPGEDAASAAKTRAMLVALNEGFDRRVATCATLNLYFAQDFSAVAQDPALRMEHRFGYDDTTMSAQRASEEVLATYVAMARKPNAPVTSFGVLPIGGAKTPLLDWLKAIDEGLAYFVELDLEGKRPPPGRLDDIRRRVRAPYDEMERRVGLASRASREVRERLVARLRHEWSVERERGPGWLTKLLVSRGVWALTHDVALSIRAGRAGRMPPLGLVQSHGADAEAEDHALAEGLIRFGVATGKRKRARAHPIERR